MSIQNGIYFFDYQRTKNNFTKFPFPLPIVLRWLLPRLRIKVGFTRIRASRKKNRIRIRSSRKKIGSGSDIRQKPDTGLLLFFQVQHIRTVLQLWSLNTARQVQFKGISNLYVQTGSDQKLKVESGSTPLNLISVGLELSA